MAGICGTDKHSYKGESVQYKGTKNEIDIPYPIIQGHENVFVIEEIDELGSRTLDFDGNILKPGDRVTMCPDVVCGICWYCKNFPTYPWCEHMLFSYGNMRSCNYGQHLYGDAPNTSISNRVPGYTKCRTDCRIIWRFSLRSCV